MFNFSKKQLADFAEKDRARASVRAAISAAARNSGRLASVREAAAAKERGNALFKSGRYEEAVEHYTSGIMLDPNNAVIAANRAMALLKLGRHAAAITDASVALSLDPTYAKAYLRRAAARRELADLQGALRDCERALELEPNSPYVREVLETIRREQVDSAISSASHEQTPKAIDLAHSPILVPRSPVLYHDQEGFEYAVKKDAGSIDLEVSTIVPPCSLVLSRDQENFEHVVRCVAPEPVDLEYGDVLIPPTFVLHRDQEMFEPEPAQIIGMEEALSDEEVFASSSASPPGMAVPAGSIPGQSEASLVSGSALQGLSFSFVLPFSRPPNSPQLMINFLISALFHGLMLGLMRLPVRVHRSLNIVPVHLVFNAFLEAHLFLIARRSAGTAITSGPLTRRMHDVRFTSARIGRDLITRDPYSCGPSFNRIVPAGPLASGYFTSDFGSRPLSLLLWRSGLGSNSDVHLGQRENRPVYGPGYLETQHGHAEPDYSFDPALPSRWDPPFPESIIDPAFLNRDPAAYELGSGFQSSRRRIAHMLAESSVNSAFNRFPARFELPSPGRGLDIARGTNVGGGAPVPGGPPPYESLRPELQIVSGTTILQGRDSAIPFELPPYCAEILLPPPYSSEAPPPPYPGDGHSCFEGVSDISGDQGAVRLPIREVLTDVDRTLGSSHGPPVDLTDAIGILNVWLRHTAGVPQAHVNWTSMRRSLEIVCPTLPGSHFRLLREAVFAVPPRSDELDAAAFREPIRRLAVSIAVLHGGGYGARITRVLEHHDGRREEIYDPDIQMDAYPSPG